MKISSRDNELKESPIRQLTPYADRARKEGVKVYHLNIGQPDIETSPPMREAYKSVPDVIAYGPSNGLLSFREKLAVYFSGLGIKVDEKDIFITTGGSEAVIFTLMSAFSQGDEVIIPEPYYTNYNAFAAMAGVKVVPITTTIENGFHLPSVEEFEKKLTSRTRGILFANPGNPTGAVYKRESLEDLVKFAKEKNLYIISDEVYRDFTYGEREAVSILEFEGIEDNAVVVDSVSKRYSACGARIGWIVTRNRRMLELVMKFAQARLCPPTVDQLAAEAALDTPASYFEAVKDEYRKRRDFAYKTLSQISGVSVTKPDGAFYVIVQLPVEDASDFSKWLLTDFRINGETTMVAPAEGFYATEGLGKNQVRLAYVLNVEDMKKAIHIIDEGLKVYPGRL